MDMAEIHNAAVPAALKALCKPILDAGGTPQDLMVAVESLVAGVFMVAVKTGGDDIVFDVMVERIRARLATERLGGLEPAGEA